jgi:hypothetical protein
MAAESREPFRFIPRAGPRWRRRALGRRSIVPRLDVWEASPCSARNSGDHMRRACPLFSFTPDASSSGIAYSHLRAGKVPAHADRPRVQRQSVPRACAPVASSCDRTARPLMRWTRSISKVNVGTCAHQFVTRGHLRAEHRLLRRGMLRHRRVVCTFRVVQPMRPAAAACSNASTPADQAHQAAAGHLSKKVQRNSRI